MNTAELKREILAMLTECNTKLEEAKRIAIQGNLDPAIHEIIDNALECIRKAMVEL